MEELKLSKRDLNNRKNKDKLLTAMHQIIKKYDYNTVTIRNLCTVSGVSYGSFYNLFKTKENFLRYYLTYDFMEYMDQYYEKYSQQFEKMNPVEKSVDIFCCCAKYNTEKGLKFVSAFYSPNNYSLFPDLDSPEQEYSFTPLLELARKYIIQAKEEGFLYHDADVEKIIHRYVYIFNGITFNWCISRGKVDIINEVRIHLNNLILSYVTAVR